MADWKSTELKLRILSALIGIPLIILFLYLGGIYLVFFIEFVIVLSFYEYLKMQNLDKTLNIITGLVLVMAIGYTVHTTNMNVPLLIFVAILPVLFLEDLNKSMKVVGGAFFISFIFFLISLRGIVPLGFYYALSIVVLTWVFDISSYFGGVLYGKHKLVPKLSPGKSYEGLIAGILVAIIASLGLFFLPLPIRILLAICISFASLAGDLIESKIKRLSKVKDSSSIIPGHGGFLDRCDSLILSAPTGYYLIILFKLGYLKY